MKDINQARRDAEAGKVVDQGFLGWAYLYGRFTEVNYQEALMCALACRSLLWLRPTRDHL